MKRLIPGFVAAAVLMAALPAAAADFGWGCEKGFGSPEILQGTCMDAVDGDMSTIFKFQSGTVVRSSYRWWWDSTLPVWAVTIWIVEMGPGSEPARVYWEWAVYDELTVGENIVLKREGYSSFHIQPPYERYSPVAIAEIQLHLAEPPPPPAAPTGLRATPGDGQVSLSWQPVEGADSYDVEMRLAGGDWQPVAIGLTATTYTVTGLQNGQAYDFRVRAVAGGTPGDWSEVVSAVPEPATPPAAPTGLRATPGDGQVSLSWQPVEGADSYDVEMRLAGGDWQPVAIGLTATTYTVTGLQNGQAYDFRVRAVGPGGPGDWSQVLTATPKPLPPWGGLFGGLVAALPAYVGGAVTGIAPIVLIPAAVTLAVALGHWFLGRLHLRRQNV